VYCLLNSDIEVTANWLAPIIDTFNTEANTAIIQPKILDYNNKDYFEYAGAAGGFIDKYGFFIKSSVFKTLNGFDPHFFAHMEEIDLCWRAKNLGHTITCVGASEVYHVGGATLKNTNPRKTFLNFRNSLLTLTKNASGFILGKIFIRLVLDGIAAIKFLLEGKPKHTLAILKAHFSFYSHLSRVLKQRKNIKNKVAYYSRASIVWDYFINKKTKYQRS